MKKTIFFISIIFLCSCSEKTYKTIYPTLSDNKYDSEFPYKNCSSELEEISTSVKKIICLVKYKSYYFNPENKLSKKDIKKGFKKFAYHSENTTETVSGTANIIYSDNDKILMLSCAHIVNAPDTIFHYFEEEKNKIKHIKCISIKTKQQNYIKDVPEDGLLKILAMDVEEDFVFLEKTYLKPQQKLKSFDYPIGKSQELEWGSFVYLMGFPTGVKMITKGIVSKSENKKSNNFYIDAVVNWGFSGSIILAVRDGVPNFEIVGIAKSTSVRHQNILKPAKDSHEFTYNPNRPYKDEVFVKIKKDINYGVTFTTSIETIKNFYIKNSRKFQNKGYNLNDFFNL